MEMKERVRHFNAFVKKVKSYGYTVDNWCICLDRGIARPAKVIATIKLGEFWPVVAGPRR